MFTGLVAGVGRVRRKDLRPPGVRFSLESTELAGDAQPGDSVALSGCCLTVIECASDCVGFDAGPETLARTNLGRWEVGSPVNWERSLRVGDRLGGHFVTGHIDTIGTLDERQDDREWSTFWIRLPARWLPHLASKGSIAIDGVSLTVVGVEADRFSVCLIPHTLAVTTLGRLQPGDEVNLETDLLAKYVEQQLEGFRS